jgi:hypothetical protein
VLGLIFLVILIILGVHFSKNNQWLRSISIIFTNTLIMCCMILVSK